MKQPDRKNIAKSPWCLELQPSLLTPDTERLCACGQRNTASKQKKLHLRRYQNSLLKKSQLRLMVESEYNSEASNGEAKLSSRNLKSLKPQLLQVHSPKEIQFPSRNFFTSDASKILTKESPVKDLEQSLSMKTTTERLSPNQE